MQDINHVCKQTLVKTTHSMQSKHKQTERGHELKVGNAASRQDKLLNIKHSQSPAHNTSNTTSAV